VRLTPPPRRPPARSVGGRRRAVQLQVVVQPSEASYVIQVPRNLGLLVIPPGTGNGIGIAVGVGGSPEISHGS
jgi:hypothetical protein